MKLTFLPIAAALFATPATAPTTVPADSLATDTTAIGGKEYDLKGVEVVARRKYVKADIDKLTYDIAHDEDSKTKNVLEMLRKVPLVTVDGQDNIKVKGSSSFKIYKNGHPDPSFEGATVSQILKSIPANTIKKIEVITDPGAKYDAEGTTAILNIVMKDNAGLEGVAGTVNLGVNHIGSFQPAFNLTTQTGKLTVAVNYGYARVSKRQSESESSGLTDYVKSGERDITQSSGHGPVDFHFGDISASYELDSLNLISLSAGGYYYKLHQNYYSSMRREDAAGQLIYGYSDHSTLPDYDYYSFNGRFDYQHKTHLDGEVLTLSYMGSTTRQNNDNDNAFSNFSGQVPFAYTGYVQRQNEKFFEHTAQADYVRPFGKVLKVETGAKYINRSNKSKTHVEYTDAASLNTGNDFSHTTQVAAAYVEGIAAMGKWSLRAGLRYEYSHMKATYPDGSQQGFSKSLSDWCPSASVQYKINDANSLRLNYATNINRPGISYLNPTRIETPTTVSYGNPALNSARNQSLEMTYMYIGKNITLNINPGYYFTNSQIASVMFVDNDKTVSTYGNINRQRDAYTNIYATVNAWKGGTLTFNGGTAYHSYRNPNADLALHGWNVYYWINYDQKLPWKLQLNAGFGGNAGHSPASVYSLNSNYWWHFFGIQRSFLKDDRLTVLIAADSPFERHSVYKSRTVRGDFLGWQRDIRNRQQLGIRISYRFGSLKATVKKVDTTIENNDMVGGIKK